MNMTRIGKLVLPALAMLFLAGCGLTAPRGNDGYADLDSLGVFDVNNTTTISIGPTLLRFAATHIEDDPETKALLKSLDGVRVRIYEVDGDVDRVAERVDRMSLKLREQSWQPLAVVQEEGERVHVLMKTSGERVSGMTVIALDEYEAVVVNIMGDIQPELFAPTMAALDVSTPDIELSETSETELGG